MNLDYVIDTEVKYDLYNKEIDGFHLWVYERAEFIWEIERKKYALNTGHSMPKESVLERLWRIAGMFGNAFFHSWTSGRHVNVLFLCHERRVLIDGQYECIYTDQIAECLSDSISLERPHHGRHYRPPRTRHLYYTDRVELKKTLFYLVEMKLRLDKYRKIRSRIEQILVEPLKELMELYEVDCEMEYFIQLALAGYYDYQYKCRAYDKLLRKLHPKMIIEVVGYNADCMIVNEIAKTMSIPTVELQHGATGREHIGYNYAQGVVLQQAPDYFLAFSDFWIDTARGPIPENCQFAVGYPYLERQSKRYKEVTLRETDPRIILFLSQGPVGERLSAIAVQLRQLLPQKEYRILYKLHPNEFLGWRDRYPELYASGLEVIDNNSKNLYEYFAMCSMQVGGFTTTAIYEGLCFGLDTYIYDYCVAPEMRRLCESGYGQLFENVDQLAEQIRDYDKETSGIQNVDFWKSDALQNAVSWIKEKLSGKNSVSMRA